jgi:hypothetical protein
MPYIEDFIPVMKYHGFSVGDSAGTTATTSSVTLNRTAGVITTPAIATGGSSIVITLTNNKIANGDMVFGQIVGGTLASGTPVMSAIRAGGGSAVFQIYNGSAANWDGGTLKIGFLVVKGISDKTS